MAENRDKQIELSRDDVWGRPRDWVLWLSLIFGVPLGALWAFHAYPLLDPNDPSLIYSAAVPFIATVLWVVAKRRTLFPWGRAAPLTMWLSIVSVGAIAALGGPGLFLAANGALDRRESVEMIGTVRDQWRRNGEFVVLLEVETSSEVARSKIDVSEAEYRGIHSGDTVLVNVKLGWLGRPWIQSQRVP